MRGVVSNEHFSIFYLIVLVLQLLAAQFSAAPHGQMAKNVLLAGEHSGELGI